MNHDDGVDTTIRRTVFFPLGHYKRIFDSRLSLRCKLLERGRGYAMYSEGPVERKIPTCPNFQFHTHHDSRLEARDFPE